MTSGDAPQADPPVPSREGNILPGAEPAAPSASRLDDAPSASDPIAAIVVTYRTGPILKACLERLAIAGGIAEIIIVDNGNPAEDEAWIDQFARRTSGVQVLRGEGNVGFGAACNRGAAVARSPWLIFVNPDLVIEPTAAVLLRTFAEKSSGLILVGGRLIGPDGREQRGCRRDEITPWSALVAALGLWRLETISPVFRNPHREREPVPLNPIQVASISGALFIIKKSCFLDVGRFDPAFFLHVEDVDLCLRVRNLGGQVWFHPHASGFHLGRSSEVSSLFVEYCKFRGFYLLFRKTSRSRADRILGQAVSLGVGVGLMIRAVLNSVIHFKFIQRCDK